MLARCPKLRLEYLRNVGDPFTFTECRETAFKLCELHKLKEPVPFDALCSCILYGDIEVRDFLLRCCDAGTALVNGLETNRSLSLDCFSMYYKDASKDAELVE